MDDRTAASALVALVGSLAKEGYSFVTVSPETHRRVDARAAQRGRRLGTKLRDVFGWSRPFEESALPPDLLRLAREAGVIAQDGGRLRATIRVSSLGDQLYVHSAYPTVDANAVFFGPDTYRYCSFVAEELEAGPRSKRLVDVGCGSGVGGIASAAYADRIVLADVNDAALAMARINASAAGLAERAEVLKSDVLASVVGDVDVVITNPPYMADPSSRAYRDGGGAFGEALAVRIAREALERLPRGGRLLLYTGAAVVDGVDVFREQVARVCNDARATWRYREIDPDVFGEEIETNDAYADVERICAVALVATKD